MKHVPSSGEDQKNRLPNVPRHLLVLVGPTASGKTAVSLLVASRLSGEIISADSRQVYRFMDIGTSKPTKAERETIRHYFVDEINPDEDFNAGRFGKKGRSVIADLFSRGKTPVVVGGSGLYVRALVDGFFDGPSADQAIRRELYQRLRIMGAGNLLDELKSVDPKTAASMLPANTRRIIRALEVYRITGTPISQLQNDRFKFDFTPVFAGLEWERAALYGRINQRVDKMIAAGLVDEAKNIISLGYSPQLNSLQTVGYKEVFSYLDNSIGEGEMVELIKRNSRRYAKRQITWFRPDKRIRWFPVQNEQDLPQIAEEICGYFISASQSAVNS